MMLPIDIRRDMPCRIEVAVPSTIQVSPVSGTNGRMSFRNPKNQENLRLEDETNATGRLIQVGKRSSANASVDIDLDAIDGMDLAVHLNAPGAIEVALTPGIAHSRLSVVHASSGNVRVLWSVDALALFALDGRVNFPLARIRDEVGFPGAGWTKVVHIPTGATGSINARVNFGRLILTRRDPGA